MITTLITPRTVTDNRWRLGDLFILLVVSPTT